MSDYKIGDWVETCQMMPGIVQDIEKDQDNVMIFYPHYKYKSPDYTGGSCCSIKHCGVHKIDESLAKMMLIIGEERLSRIWEFLKRDAKIVSIEKNIDFYNKVFIKSYENMSIEKRKLLKSSTYSFYNEEKLSGLFLYHKRLKEYKEKVEELVNIDLVNAWKKHNELYHQTIIDLYNNVINHTTQGIWLSYHIINKEKLQDNKRIITLETGEKFMAYRIYGKYKLIEKLN